VLKRVRWLATGVAVGAGASLWAERKAKAVVARYSPAGVASGAARRARGLPSDVVAAIREGREAMREREAQLRGGTGGALGQVRGAGEMRRVEPDGRP
jgi:hypothetical protein